MESSALKPRLGISACLLGAEVRYNGGHKESRLCSRTLSDYFDFTPVCPEVAIGLGIPREPIRLVGDPEQPRAVGTVRRELDVSDALTAYGERMAEELGGICGYIFMQQSPSCGLERVKVYQENGHPSEPRGRGLFAAAWLVGYAAATAEGGLEALTVGALTGAFGRIPPLVALPSPSWPLAWASFCLKSP